MLTYAYPHPSHHIPRDVAPTAGDGAASVFHGGPATDTDHVRLPFPGPAQHAHGAPAVGGTPRDAASADAPASKPTAVAAAHAAHATAAPAGAAAGLKPHPTSDLTST